MGRGDGVNERLLENENNRLSDQLAGKISKLKQISIEMKVRSIFFLSGEFLPCHKFLRTGTRYRQTVFSIVFLVVSSLIEKEGFFPEVVDDVIAISGPFKSQICKKPFVITWSQF